MKTATLLVFLVIPAFTPHARAQESAPALPYPCFVCNQLRAERPVLDRMPQIRMPTRAELLADAPALEAADLAAFEAVRSGRCMEGATACLAWAPGGAHFNAVSFR